MGAGHTVSFQEATEIGTDLTLLISLGTGLFELTSGNVYCYSGGLSCAARAAIATLPESNTEKKDWIASGYVTDERPLIIPYPRIIEGPCLIAADLVHSDSVTMKLAITYRRIL